VINWAIGLGPAGYPDIPNLIEPVVDNMIERISQEDLIRHLLSLFLWGGWYAGDSLSAGSGENQRERS